MSETPNKARDVFIAAVKLAPEQWDAYLNGACGGDEALRDRVQDLLVAHQEAGSFLEPAIAALAVTTEELVSERPGTVIGPYKLLEQIGEGGMGLVFVAEQQQPVRRKVALKVIKPGMDTRQVVARFEAERQALALMDHPNIAKVFDGGETASGRPYFVMELVNGVPITAYCDQNQVPIRQRLQLFVSVCQAVQHAHQKGIIHRDIKPSNVLVMSHDGTPVVKVIDFGVAKALHQPLTEQSVSTEIGQVVGTLEYMSPEQAELHGLDIDTQADVYALGVLLYELLTGTTPLERQRLKETPVLQVLRLIREEEPPRPSTRLRACKETLVQMAALRRTEPGRLIKEASGELDWIVMKALEKDRTRRYETANSLARDIQRYLAEEPVEAGPPSAAYRLRKLAWRHRRGLAMAAALLLLLVLGAAVSTILAVWAMREERLANQRLGEATAQKERAERAEAQVREQLAAVQQQKERAQKAETEAKGNEAKARQEESKARQSAADARAVLAYFQNTVLGAGRPLGQPGGLGRRVTLREAVDAAEPVIAKAFAKRPLVEASIRDTLGTTYLYLGEAKLAIPQHERALALHEAKLGTNHPETLISRNNLAVAYESAGRIPEAVRLHEQILRQREMQFGADHPDTLTSRNNLAAAYLSVGRTAEAVRLHEHNLQCIEAKLGPNHPHTLLSRNNLAAAYRAAGRLPDAIRLHEQVVKQAEAQRGANHPDTLRARNNLAEEYLTVGRLAEAIPLLEQTLQQEEDKLGPDHPETLAARNNLAEAYLVDGRTTPAIRLHQQNLRGIEAKHGPGHPRAFLCRNNLAGALQKVGRAADAEPLYRANLAQMRREFGREDPRTARPMAALGLNLLLQHKYADAEAVLRDCLRVREKKLPDDWNTFHAQSLLGDALLGQKKYTEAEPLLLQGYQGMTQRAAKIPPQDQARLTEALERLVRLYEAMDQKDKADAWRKKRKQTTDAPKKEASVPADR